MANAFIAIFAYFALIYHWNDDVEGICDTCLCNVHHVIFNKISGSYSIKILTLVLFERERKREKEQEREREREILSSGSLSKYLQC